MLRALELGINIVAQVKGPIAIELSTIRVGQDVKSSGAW